MCISVVPQHVFEVEARFQHSVALHRQKRAWIVPPQILEENVDFTKKEFIAKVSETSPASLLFAEDLLTLRPSKMILFLYQNRFSGNFALSHFLVNRSSAVNGCRQNESLNS